MNHVAKTLVGFLTICTVISLFGGGPQAAFFLVTILVVCTFGVGLIPLVMLSYGIGSVIFLFLSLDKKISSGNSFGSGTIATTVTNSKDRQALVDYIQKARAKGQTGSEIEVLLKKNGWGQQIIEESLKTS